MRIVRPWRDFTRPRFLTGLGKAFLEALGSLALVAGLYDVFNPNEIAGSDISPWWVLLTAALYAIYRGWPRPIERAYSRPNTRVSLVEGNLFDRPTHLVINMTSTFDTEVSPDIIAKSSVQAQFLEKVYGGNRHELDADLTAALASVPPKGTISKPGKQTVYPVGTVATLTRNGRRYFCLAFTELDEANKAHGSLSGLWVSLVGSWDEVRRRSNGEPVAIPVVGGGQSGMSSILSSQDSIRLIAASFMFASRQSKVCDRLGIVVRRDQTKFIDMPEIQAFLDAMAA